MNNSPSPCEPKDSLKLILASGKSLRLSIRGLGHCPSFKTQKGAAIHRVTGKPFPVTSKKIKEWMRRATESIASQLFWLQQTVEPGTLTVEQARSSIVSLLPLDDSRQWISEIVIRDAQVEPGHEGADILIERLDSYPP